MPVSETTSADSRMAWNELDHSLMRRALELAARGIGQVSPSPLVGCVIATDAGAILGEGFYLYEGLKHAETLALEQAGEQARGATAYVSLEPHAHFGRTPPCTEALIRAGIKRVVVPIEDPNPKVSGQGFTHLREAGLVVDVGLLAREASRLNEKYIHFMRTGRPFVHLKLAVSLDGRIATRTGDSRWITGPAAREAVQKLRHESDAILIGAGTALADNPILTDRSNLKRRRPLVRVLLDRSLRLPPDSNLAVTAREFPLLIFTAAPLETEKAQALIERGAELIPIPGAAKDLSLILDALAQRELHSVLLEGGAGIAGAFRDAGLIDKASFFLAPLIIGGTDAPSAVGGVGAERLADALRLADVTFRQHGADFELTGYPERRSLS